MSNTDNTPPLEGPLYVLVTDTAEASGTICRQRRVDVSRAALRGEYTPYATGNITSMRELFRDLTGGAQSGSGNQ